MLTGFFFVFTFLSGWEINFREMMRLSKYQFCITIISSGNPIYAKFFILDKN